MNRCSFNVLFSFDMNMMKTAAVESNVKWFSADVSMSNNTNTPTTANYGY